VRARDQCAFCPERANITGEHLWSHWAEKAFGPRRYQYIHRDSENAVIKTWQKDSLDLKTKVVCAECYNGWMSEVETATKLVIQEMILDYGPTILNARDLATIAAFGLLKATVADCIQSKRPPVLTFSERTLFARSLRIPLGVQMWLGSLADPHGLFKSRYIETPVNTPRGFYLQSFTYGLGCLVIQVTVSRWRKKSSRRHTGAAPCSNSTLSGPRCPFLFGRMTELLCDGRDFI
jgi:hypothetical protein